MNDALVRDIAKAVYAVLVAYKARGEPVVPHEVVQILHALSAGFPGCRPVEDAALHLMMCTKGDKKSAVKMIGLAATALQRNLLVQEKRDEKRGARVLKGRAPLESR